MPTDPSSLRPEHPQREPSFAASSRQLGMWIFLGSLVVLFGASILAYLLTRANHPNWAAIEVKLPWSLVGAGVFLVSTSVFAELAVSAIRRNDQARLQRELWLTTASAAAFIVAQTFNWRSVMQHSGEGRALSLFTFYMLTGLHALHVIGGFVPLGIVLHHSKQRDYSSSRYEGVKLCAQYWHFLGVIWIVLMLTMALT